MDAGEEQDEPLILFVPDGNGGMVLKEVKDAEEYRALWCQEGRRIIKEATASNEAKPTIK